MDKLFFRTLVTKGLMANTQIVWAMIGEKMLKPIESGE